MAQSKIDIANIALGKLGEPLITSFNDITSLPSIMFESLFDMYMDILVSKHPWNFATKRAQLAEKVSTPLFGWSKAFALPADYLTMVATKDYFSYKIELLDNEKVLFSDQSIVQIKYISQVTNTALFPPYFSYLLAMFLCKELGATLAPSSLNLKSIGTEFNNALLEAKRLDSQEGTPDRIEDNWVYSGYLNRGYRIQ